VSRSRSRRAGRARAVARAPARGRRPSPAEAALLELARSLGAGAPESDAVTAMLSRLEQAFAPGAPLPRQLAHAWLRTRGDKTGALALGWAREQVRRALADVLLRQDPPAGGRGRGLADLTAWLLLAVAEAEAHEPGGAVGDRLRMVLELVGRISRR
jgi:hypothetical protein